MKRPLLALLLAAAIFGFILLWALLLVPRSDAYHRPPRVTQTTWTEDWSNVLAGWYGIGDANPAAFNPVCWTASPGLLDMKCQSAALISYLKLNKNYRIEVNVSVKVGAGNRERGTAYVAIVGKDDPDCDYDGLYLNYGDSISRITDCYQQLYMSLIPGQWHTLKIVYYPLYRMALHYLDGALLGTHYWRLDFDPSIWVGCVSVGPGTPDDKSWADCQFGTLTITGTAR